MDLVSLVLLAMALSLDSLMVGLLYGARGIRLPTYALFVISMATGLLLALAMGGGSLLAVFLAPAVAQRLGAVLLTCAGVWITVQTWRNRRDGGKTGAEFPPKVESQTDLIPRRVLHLRLGSIGIVIEILRQPSRADLDHSGHISLSEACFLGVALALDSVTAGLGAAMAGYSPLELPLAAALGSFCLMYVGSRGASWLPFKLEGRWAMLHGLALVVLGVYRMVV